MMVTDGIPSSMAKNSWNSFGPCCRSSDKEGAHMKRTWKVLLVCVVAVAALAGYFFLLPAPAGGEDFQLLEVRQDGRDLTASLRPEQLADLEATMRGGLQVPLEESHWGISSGSGYCHAPGCQWGIRHPGGQPGAIRGGRLSDSRRGSSAGGGSEHPRILIHFAYR